LSATLRSEAANEISGEQKIDVEKITLVNDFCSKFFAYILIDDIRKAQLGHCDLSVVAFCFINCLFILCHHLLLGFLEEFFNRVRLSDTHTHTQAQGEKKDIKNSEQREMLNSRKKGTRERERKTHTHTCIMNSNLEEQKKNVPCHLAFPSMSLRMHRALFGFIELGEKFLRLFARFESRAECFVLRFSFGVIHR
jgi:hypothetical protein